MTAPRLILASQSPGRAAILRAAGVGFRQLVSSVDEEAEVARESAALGRPLTSEETALTLARLKAEAVAELPESQGSLVLGCDSVFELDGVPYGKPYTPERAIERLTAQSGRTGLLHSGHWLVDTRDTPRGSQADDAAAASGRLVTTAVTFGALSEELIRDYVATGEPLHCAGSFTIDARGAALIERIEGDPAAVVGLSVRALTLLLESRGVRISDLWEI